MVFSLPFSSLFWICYILAGLSDVLDGIAARKLLQESSFGAKLDSIADLIFACVIAGILVLHVPLPIWLWICIVVVALLRLFGYAIGYFKYHTFSPLHTYANKFSGALLFAFPLLYTVFGIEISGILTCAVTALSAMEEILITMQSDHLNRDLKSIFAAKPSVCHPGKSNSCR